MMCRILTVALLSILIAVEVHSQSSTCELAIRGGLKNTKRQLMRDGKDTFRVAFFGGSITEAANGWRDGTVQWLQQQTARPVKGINAAIGGTGSSLGVYRLGKDVLRYRPQLMFIEFAVNDGKDARETILQSMEGIVRQTRRALPQTDICFVYTISATMAPQYQGDNLPTSVKAMEDLANYYHIPSINLAPRILKEVSSGKMFFEGKRPRSGDSLFFSPDGTHPFAETGYRMYNETIQAALPQLFKKGRVQNHNLPHSFFSDEMETATLLLVKPEQVSGAVEANFSVLDSIASRFPRHFSSVVHLTDTSQRLTFSFTGDRIGFFDIIGPSSANLKIVVDGGAPRKINRFDRFCTFYRPHWFFVDSLPEGQHKIEVSLSPEKIDKEKILGRSISGLPNAADYKKQDWRVGYFLVENTEGPGG